MDTRQRRENRTRVSWRSVKETAYQYRQSEEQEERKREKKELLASTDGHAMSALWSRANWQPQSRGSRALLGYWKHCSKTQQPPPPHCITISDNVVITFEGIFCRWYLFVPGESWLFGYSLFETRSGDFAMGQQGWKRHKEINSIRFSFTESITLNQ